MSIKGLAILCLLLGAGADVPKNPANLISAATLFTGPAAPVVDLGYARYRGKQDATTKTSNYLGLKFAEADRFDHSKIVGKGMSKLSNEVIDASDYGPACAQHSLTTLLSPDDVGVGQAVSFLEATPLLQGVVKQSEDCLYINVQRPQDESLNDLPVVVWIHGGGFETGSSSSILSEVTAVSGAFYQGAKIVKRSVEMKQPVVVASIQYRLGHFGFSASKEMEDAELTNLGFEDQRNALRWIQSNIKQFGGDPKRVTLLGESAGAWSAVAHMVANDGDNEGLFSSVIGMSGAGLKVEGQSRQQQMFDDLSKYVGCEKASDKVVCLRKAPYEKIYAHQGTIPYYIAGYRGLASPWTLRPSPNDRLLKRSPHELVAEGKMADVPLLMGDMKDEGPLFSLISGLNTTTEEAVKDYFKTWYWPNATGNQLDRLMELYPADYPKGSPYDTGVINSLVGPQYKRIASIIGDYSFESQRRQLFSHHKGPIWTYQTEVSIPLSVLGDSFLGNILGDTGLTDIPILGSFHAFDVMFYLFETLPAILSNNVRNIMDNWISFVYNENPNQHDLDIPYWPQWDKESKQMYHFQESGPDVIEDTYREEQMDFINENSDSFLL